MTDNLSDIDPAIVDFVLTHADVFAEVDRRVKEVMDWGVSELDKKEAEIKVANGTFGEYQTAAQQIDIQVKAKLAALEAEYRSKYPPIVED